MTGERPFPMQAMNMWFQMSHTELFSLEGWRKQGIDAHNDYLLRLGKPGFYKLIISNQLDQYKS
jgi:hypothetical protein